MKFKAKHDYIQDLNTFWGQCIQAFYNTLALEREGNRYTFTSVPGWYLARKTNAKGSFSAVQFISLK